jgi:hypothetical protein
VTLQWTTEGETLEALNCSVRTGFPNTPMRERSTKQESLQDLAPFELARKKWIPC